MKSNPSPRDPPAPPIPILEKHTADVVEVGKVAVPVHFRTEVPTPHAPLLNVPKPEPFRVYVPPMPKLPPVLVLPAPKSNPVIVLPNPRPRPIAMLENAQLLKSTQARPCRIREGWMWLEDGNTVVVKFTGGFERRHALKARGFTCNYGGDKSWSLSLPTWSAAEEDAMAVWSEMMHEQR